MRREPLEIRERIYEVEYLAIKAHHPIHLEIQRRDSTPIGILCTTYRDPVSGRMLIASGAGTLIRSNNAA